MIEIIFGAIILYFILKIYVADEVHISIEIDGEKVFTYDKDNNTDEDN